MADVNLYNTRGYNKSAALEEETPMQRAAVILKELPVILVKIVIFLGVAIFYTLRTIFHLFVPKTPEDIRGRLAVVTGGGNGIGREICLELACCGCNVACLDLDLDGAEQVCAELRQLGVKANAYKVDVTDYERVEQIKNEINSDMGVVDILINNAGLLPQDPSRDTEPSNVRRMMDINVLSHFWTTRVFIGDMIKRRCGHIVAVASLIAFFPTSNALSYTTSKYAVKGFMDALNRDSRHGNWGIKTLTVYPHLTNTRKEITDYFRKTVIKPEALELLRVQPPSKVGRDAVRALRLNSGYVSSPRYFLPLGHFLQSLSYELNIFFDSLFMPWKTSSTNFNVNGDNK